MKNFKLNEEGTKNVVRKNIIKKRVIKITASVVTVALMGLVVSTSGTMPMQSAKSDVLIPLSNNTTTTPVGTEEVVTGTTISSTTSTTKSTTTTTTSTTTNTSTSTTTTDSTTSSLITTSELVTEATTVAETIETPTVEVESESVQDTEPAREYIVYKPSTHYVHKNTCRWFNNECEEITSTEGLECRRCAECNPDIEIITEYVVPQPVVTTPAVIETTTPPTSTVNTSEHAALNYVTEDERVYLCNVVGSEYGSDWVSLYDKACVVATVMNRYYDGGWQGYGRSNTIYNVITAPGQFNPAYAVNYYRYNVTDSCIQAVDYYFENMSIFPHYTSFWGDGTANHFS